MKANLSDLGCKTNYIKDTIFTFPPFNLKAYTTLKVFFDKLNEVYLKV